MNKIALLGGKGVRPACFTHYMTSLYNNSNIRLAPYWHQNITVQQFKHMIIAQRCTSNLSYIVYDMAYVLHCSPFGGKNSDLPQKYNKQQHDKTSSSTIQCMAIALTHVHSSEQVRTHMYYSALKPLGTTNHSHIHTHSHW